MNVYFLSGLGADKRVFDKITLPSHCQICHIDWEIPHKNESIQAYAKRLLNQINTQQPFSLVGLSFGGMVAIEIAKIAKPLKTILISSVANRTQLPWHYKAMGRIKVYNYLPLQLMKRRNQITNWFFGTKDAEEQRILGEVIAETDSTYLKWALKMISTWKNKTLVPNLVHIHGESDRLFPLKFVKPHIIVPKGSHLMVRENADEISAHLIAILGESKSNY